ncbi:organic cation transporter protein-like [Pecten maximus]|uniref:organic cation transporter protein-like n=1 Tax=Pecten maximus TaxID=6579 RepID=UPI001458B8F4|nr:organic cation transporter protein-like [Pecten maximus]
MKFDDILIHIGEFGFYQKRLYLLLCMPAISVGCYMMMLVIIMATPEHRCQIPGYENDTFTLQNDIHRNLVNASIPLASPDDDFLYDKCHMYTCNDGQSAANCAIQNRTRIKCSSWVYDRETFHETFTSKTNLVCDDALKTSHAQMLFYFGVLVGDLGFGMIADIIGRKKTLYVTVVILLGSAFGVAWAETWVSFVVLEFVIGAANHGAFIICCVLGLEMVGPSKRVWAGILVHAFFALGLVYLVGMGYFLRDWFWVQIAVAAPCAFFLSYWFVIPESPRWLISQKRYSEADKIIERAARVNKKPLPPSLMKVNQEKDEKEADGRIWHLFSNKVLLSRTLIVYFNWAVVSMIYYGVTMHTGNMNGDFYLNFFLLAVVEFPAYFMSIALLDRWGRKRTHCACMLLGGIACISTIFPVIFGGPDLQPLTLALAIVGKIGAAGAFGVIYVFSAELFPTVVRNAGMGSSSCVARVGGMLAPYVASSGDLVGGKFGKALPLVIFGAFSVSAGLLCLLLPETLHKKLPETIEDGINFNKGSKKELYEKS